MLNKLKINSFKIFKIWDLWVAKSYAQNILCNGLKMMPVTNYIKYTQDPRDGLVGEEPAMRAWQSEF